MSYPYEPVKIPYEKGRIIIRNTVRKNGKGPSYVLYELEHNYCSVRKFNAPKRIAIGKVCPDDETMMLPNENFNKVFPEIFLDGNLNSPRKRSDRLKAGVYSLIDKVLEKDIIEMIIPEFGCDYHLLLDLASYLMYSDNNLSHDFESYAFDHVLFAKDMSPKYFTKESLVKLLNQRIVLIEASFYAWQRVPYQKQRIFLSMTLSDKIGVVDTIGDGNRQRPVSNIALAYDKDNKQPLYYIDYPVALDAIGQINYVAHDASKRGYDDLAFIIDKTKTINEDAIKYMDEKSYSFIIKLDGSHELVARHILENKNSFEKKDSNLIGHYQVYGTTLSGPLFDGDNKERYLHLYFDPTKYATESCNLVSRIDKMKEYVKGFYGTDTVLDGLFAHYFNLKYKDGKLRSAKVKEDVYQKELESLGYFCLVTSEKMTAHQAILLYKSRVQTSRPFGCPSTFFGTDDEVLTARGQEAFYFIDFISLLMKQRLYNALEAHMDKMDVDRDYLSLPNFLKEMDKIEFVRRSDDRYYLEYALTDKQKEIFAAFGLDEKGSIKYLRKRASFMILKYLIR